LIQRVTVPVADRRLAGVDPDKRTLRHNAPFA